MQRFAEIFGKMDLSGDQPFTGFHKQRTGEPTKQGGFRSENPPFSLI